VETIERDELRAKLDRGDNFRLVMTLGGWAYRAAHIPGSLNYETPEAGMADLSINEEIVVYCSDEACTASRYAYQQLVDHGYTNVRRYSGGLADWSAAGLPLEGDGKPPHLA
jgi:rhodanese-related sulfurtransferase